MRTTDRLDRDQIAYLLPDDQDESVIAAENLTLSTVPYHTVREQRLDAAENKKLSAIERIANKKREMECRKELASQRFLEAKRNRQHPLSREIAAESYKLNRPGAGVSGPGSCDTPSPVSQLMKDIGVNLELKFSRKDTYDLMSVLLTCSEAQLEAMTQNRRVPVMVKTIIKAIQEDYKRGSTTTVEKLWNRIFGSTFTEPPAQTAAPAGGTTINVLSVVPGIGTGTRPISREGYAIIRDRLFGAEAETEEVNG